MHRNNVSSYRISSGHWKDIARQPRTLNDITPYRSFHHLLQRKTLRNLSHKFR